MGRHNLVTQGCVATATNNNKGLHLSVGLLLLQVLRVLAELLLTSEIGQLVPRSELYPNSSAPHGPAAVSPVDEVIPAL